MRLNLDDVQSICDRMIVKEVFVDGETLTGNTDSQDAVFAKPKRGRGRLRKIGITQPALKCGRG